MLRQRRPREKNEKHLKFVRGLPCCISGRTPCQPHHLLNVPGRRGVGMKADDRYTVPLHPEIHSLLHRECASKTEDEWFVEHGVKPDSMALFLWHNSGNQERCENFILGHST
jgi:hypothetical protein